MAKTFLTPITLPAGSTAPTPSAGDNSTKLATTAYVDGALSGYVTTASYTAADVRAKLLTVDGASSGIDADLLDGYHADFANTGNTVPIRNSSGDITTRLFRSEFGDQSTISGAVAFRVNNSTNNYIRFCSDSAAVRGWLGLGGTVQSGNYLQYTNGNGYIQIGPNNTGFCHFLTDRPAFYMGKPLQVNGAISEYDTGRRLGYREAVMVNMSGSVTLDDTHSGKTFYNNKGVSYTITIPTGLNAGMMFQVIAYGSGSSIVLSRNGTNLYWIKGDGTAPNANRTVGAFGWATVYTLNGTAWFITGVGIT